jgi:serine/threonine-protein kinase
VVDSNTATQLRDPLVQAARARVGQVLNAKYRLDRLLGIGGMAAVYAATHLRNANRVALKILHRELSVDRDLRARFLREGYAANSVEHPGTVRVTDDEVAEDGAVFLVMDLLDGETLDARWERSGRRLRVAEVVTLTNELLDVLAAAHAKGIVHRDIKPENLFLTRDGRLRVLDFGVARLRETSPTKTKSGAVFGTPAFMPPEQALGRVREVDALSDVWAVGATAFTLLTGRFVHEGETGEEMVVRAATTPVPPLASFFMLTIPEPIARVIDRALSFERRDRWPSALAMKEALIRARDETILATADDWGLGDEKTRLAPAPKMTLHPEFASGPQDPTVPLPTLPASVDGGRRRIQQCGAASAQSSCAEDRGDRRARGGCGGIVARGRRRCGRVVGAPSGHGGAGGLRGSGDAFRREQRAPGRPSSSRNLGDGRADRCHSDAISGADSYAPCAHDATWTRRRVRRSPREPLRVQAAVHDRSSHGNEALQSRVSVSRWSRPMLVALGAVLLPRSARADGPTKLECIAANDVAQELRHVGKLREAREKLALCVSATCPGPVREDCAQRLTEVDAVMPSVVFEAQDEAGNDLLAITVTMDGHRLPGTLTGLPVPLDPGEHHFAFDDADGLAHIEKTIVVHEGERDRRERIVLGRFAARSPPSVLSSRGGGSQRTVTFVLGGAGVVGLAVGSVLGLVSKASYDHALQTECSNNQNTCSPQGVQDGKSAHGQAAASTVAFVAGGVLLGAGAVLYFTSPRASVGVGTTVGTERAGIAVSGAW